MNYMLALGIIFMCYSLQSYEASNSNKLLCTSLAEVLISDIDRGLSDISLHICPQILHFKNISKCLVELLLDALIIRNCQTN